MPQDLISYYTPPRLLNAQRNKDLPGIRQVNTKHPAKHGDVI